MDPEFLIPLAPFLMVAFIFWVKHKSKIAQLQADVHVKETAEKAAQYAQHTSQLEERVRVLERIVTSSGYDIATQIEALRLEDSDHRLGAPPASATDTDKTVN